MTNPTLERRVADVESEVFQLRHRTERDYEALGNLAAGINAIVSEVRQADAHVDRLGSDLLAAMAEIGRRQDGLDERFGGLEGRVEAVEERLGKIEDLLGQILQRLPA